MKAKNPPGTLDLFRARLTQILDHQHPLYRLAGELDWSAFELAFGSTYCEDTGRPAKPIRLLVGLHYLKHAFNESDESVVARWVENPYWQFFCGGAYFQHELPVDPTLLVKWRHRVGAEKLEALLAETIATARRQKLVTPQQLSRVTVDTTVQEKAVAFPTDARLAFKALAKLVRLAQRRGLRLRQSYCRLAKTAFAQQGRYARARQMKRAAKQTKKLRGYLGRVARDIERKMTPGDEELAALLALVHRLLAQTRDSRNKLYSLAAPEVECLAKGKAHQRYEFGCKVGLVTTARGNWVLGSQALHGNPYDGHTLGACLDQAARITGVTARHAYCDQGYRGHGFAGDAEIHIVGRGRRKLRRTERGYHNRRAAIEPIIGHMKTDHRMIRNFLKGQRGDRCNAVLAACGYNIRKLLRALARFFLSLVGRLSRTAIPIHGGDSLYAAV